MQPQQEVEEGFLWREGKSLKPLTGGGWLAGGGWRWLAGLNTVLL